MATPKVSHESVEVYETENYDVHFDPPSTKASTSEPTTETRTSSATSSPLLPAWARKEGYANLPQERRLHEEILDFAKWIEPWEDEKRMREFVAEKVTLLVKELWPKAEVRIYGSFYTNLYLPSSDIDVVVLGAPPDSGNQLALLQLADRLHARGETTMHVIPTAKVPIIKLIECETNCMVDISFNVNSGPENNEIVLSYLREHAELRPLVLVLKYFLAQNRLNEPYWGGMGSYALVLLATFLIKRRKAAAPSATTMFNLGDLLVDFFRFFGKELQTESEAVSVTNPEVFTKESRGWFDPANPLSYSVEDPQNAENDVGRGMFSAAAVRRAFSGAHDSVTAVHTLPTLLSAVIVSDKLLESFREQVMSHFAKNRDRLLRTIEAQRLVVQNRSLSPEHESRRRRANSKGKATHTGTHSNGQRNQRRQSESPRTGATGRPTTHTPTDVSAP